MKKALLIFFLLISAAALAGADIPYRHTVKKAVVLNSFTAAFLAADYVTREFHYKDTALEYGLDRLHKSDVFFVDRAMMHDYSENLDTAGDIVLAAAMVMPGILAFDRTGGEMAELGFMYLETLALAHSFKELIKSTVTRYRPYTYYDDTKNSMLRDDDSSRSFVSGHSTMAFASASFLSKVYWDLHPDENSRYLVAGVSFAAAGAVGVLRILSGNHFFTDVLAGAALGTFAGWFVPRYYLDRDRDFSLSFFSPEGEPGIAFRCLK